MKARGVRAVKMHPHRDLQMARLWALLHGEEASLASGLQTPKLEPGDELSTSFKLPQDVVAQTFVANM